MNPQPPLKAGDFVEATVLCRPPRTIRLRLYRAPCSGRRAGTLVVCDRENATLVRADSVRRVDDDTTTGRSAASRPPDGARQSGTESPYAGDTCADRSE